MRLLRRFWLLALPISCLDATQITLSITTDAKCADLQGVAIAVGKPSDIDALQPATVTPNCRDDGTIGTIAVVPSSAGDDVAVRVVAGFKRSVNDCTAPFGDGCIVARRELHYVPHTPLYLPVVLSVDCAGVPCDSTSTCVNGECKPAGIPDPSTCTTPDGCALDGGTTPLAFDPECGDMSGLGGGASWAMTSACPTHIARSPYLGPQSAPQIAWSYTDGSAAAILSVPVATSDGTLFLGMPNGVATALDLATGTLRWSVPAGSSLGGNAAVGADGTFVISGSNGLMGFDSATHALRWGINELGADVTIGAGEIVYEASLGVLHAKDATSGGELWQTTTQAAPTAFFASPAISPDGLLYLSATDGTIAAVDATTHALRWSNQIVGEGVPLAVTGRVYVATGESQTIFAFDSQGGKLWTHAGATSSYLALTKNGTIVAAISNQVIGIDASNNLLWSIPTPAAITSGLVIDGAGIVYGITSEADVVAVDPANPAGPRWVKNVPTASDLMLAKGTLVVVTTDGHVVALR